MIKALTGRLRQIFNRRLSYKHVFLPNGATTVASKIVLADLRRFCRGTATPAVMSHITQNIDPMATGIAIGRQEVWHHICQHLYLDDADIYRLVEQQSDGTEDN